MVGDDGITSTQGQGKHVATERPTLKWHLDVDFVDAVYVDFG